MRVVAVVAVVSAALLIGGGLTSRLDPLRLSAIVEPRMLTIVVTLPRVSDAYRWLSVYGCSAEVTETGTYCTGDFERESTLELFNRKQELVYWRNLPAGTLRITAMAFDVGGKMLASDQMVVLRGR